jgi:hypothetical protein
MENLITLKIFMKKSLNTNNKYNKDLIKFLNNNLKEIVDSNYYTRLIIVDQSNIKKIGKLGIKKTPALLNDDTEEIIFGTENIIQYIISKCEDDFQQPVPVTKPKVGSGFNNRKDDLREYLMEQAMSLDNEPEEPLNLDKFKNYDDNYTKNRERLQSRNINTNKNIMNTLKKNTNFNSGENAEAGAFIKNSNEETITRNITSHIDNDDETRQYWENQEETII